MSVAVCVSVPLTPVTVTVAAPAVAVPLAASVSVVVLVDEAGLKVAVTPLGKPLAVKVTAPVNPLSGFTVIVLVPLAPCRTLKVAGAAAMVKSGEAGAVTVRLTAAVWVSPLLVPVTMTLAMPIVAALLAEKVSVLLPVEDTAPKLAVTPVGRPLALNATVPVKPLSALTVIVSVAVAPRATVTLADEDTSAKSGDAVPDKSP